MLLKEAGWEVGGVVMRMSPQHDAAVEAARAAAERLQIPLTVLDLQAEFSERIIEYFVREYAAGRTPNPCVLCNPTVKFAHLLALADEQGYDRIATGHYARLTVREGRTLVARAACEARDQSYMLYRLGQPVLTRLLLPLDEAEDKQQIRALCRERQMPFSDAPDSSENCFLADKDYTLFLHERLGDRPGDIIAPDGSVCGRHNGLYRFTVGQRKGLVALGRPAFVKALDAEHNRVLLGWGGEEYAAEADADDCLLHLPMPQRFTCEVKVRSMAKPVAATVEVLPQNRVHVTFSQPQRAVAPGQSAVFYVDGAVIGGGILCR